jgi:hypothetical protein
VDLSHRKKNKRSEYLISRGRRAWSKLAKSRGHIVVSGEWEVV